MQRKQIWTLNVVLIAAAAFMLWRIEASWKQGNERYARLAQVSAAAGPVYSLAAPSAENAPTGADVIAKSIFSPDRNSETTKTATAMPAPPLPTVFGTMQLGSAREALMAEGSAAATRGFRRVKLGEQLGGYKIVEIADESVIVEFQGQKTTINVYQARTVASAMSSTAPAMAAPPPAAPMVDTVQAAPAVVPAPAPAAAAPQTPASQQPGVRVSIEGNRKRFEKDSAFGPQVWYEDIPQ